MTDREKAIVMAHTGICMLAGEKFGVFHAYIEDIMGRPVYTHELAIQSISDEIKEKSRDDFLKLCREEQESCGDAISRAEAFKTINNIDIPEDMSVFEIKSHIGVQIGILPPVTPQSKMGRWIAYEVRLSDRTILNYRCSVCGRKLIGYDTETLNEVPFCHCGAKMQESEDKG